MCQCSRMHRNMDFLVLTFTYNLYSAYDLLDIYQKKQLYSTVSGYAFP